ncbi:Rrn5p NDAI_0G02470 [Naumovozyma dairenensis CBS 421]|uniref:Uncharacterized protein n=1 Tax=Naumovozyma dairenensis (strain ATCC 10597 / BCRC 20456 / CBS 421 / NBRC 0211 / NRRL Y-12639) TaxID=1071378 RepID=G0WE11_NAUDC|nr:hypothetical protein NDAI_0G02470 [Naumovozyma dairenensis CBS 421]CCD26022.2 hypothetical protein NDAI_0G02470 [Naumovozyma dairenensis CBS 421]
MGRPRRDLVKLYYDHFNGEVRQFLDPTMGIKYELRGSRIHVDSRVKYLEDKNVETTDRGGDDSDLEGEEEEVLTKRQAQLGTDWTSKEKHLFFFYLARYSIHRLDEWYLKIGGKMTKYEVLVYYDVLKRNLNELKYGEGKTNGNDMDLRRRTTSRFGRLLTLVDFPIAYEMDDSFIRLENKLSRMVSEELNKNDKSTTMEEISEEGNENEKGCQDLDQGENEDSNEERDGEEPHNKDRDIEISVAETMDYFNLQSKSWRERWKLLSSATHQTDKLALPSVTKDCHEYLTELVIDHVEGIFAELLLLPMADQRGFSRNEENISWSENPVVVVKATDIKKSLRNMRVHKHRPTDSGLGILETFDKFNVRPRLGSITKKSSRSKIKSLLKNPAEASLVEAVLSNKDDESVNVPSSRIPTRTRKRNKRESSSAKDSKHRRLERILTNWENKLMEIHDKRASQIYARTLLQYFLYQIPEEDDSKEDDSNVLERVQDNEDESHNNSGHDDNDDYDDERFQPIILEDEEDPGADPEIAKIPHTVKNRFLHYY